MNRVRERVLAALFAVLAVTGIAFLIFGAGGNGKPERPSPPTAVTGEVLRRDNVISDKGYNTFAGAWIMPGDGAVATAYANVTGPVAPPCRSPEVPAGCAERGFRGARHRFVVLESGDGAKTWKKPFAAEVVKTPAPHAYSGQPTIALRDGTLLRRVNGEDIGIYPEYGGEPGTAYLQRRAPGAKSWSGRQLLLDTNRYTYNLSRMKRLRDGRTLVALGAFWKVRAGERLKTPAQERPGWLLMTSTDEGATWQNAMAVPGAAEAAALANEWDVAELRDGDLLAVMRTREGERAVRKQVVLEKTGDEITTNTGTRSKGGWTMGVPVLTPAPFAQIEFPQHPELLDLEHGPAAGGILHIADEAIHYTANGGRSWSKVAFPSNWNSHYYPNSVQASGGNIYVFSHAGGDENYTTNADKPIYVDVVRLVADGDALP